MQCVVLSSRVLTSEPLGQLLLPLGWKPTFFHKPFVTQVDKAGSRPKARKQGESASVPQFLPLWILLKRICEVRAGPTATECLMVLLITWSCRQAIYHGTLHCKWRARTRISCAVWKKKENNIFCLWIIFNMSEYFKKSSKWKKISWLMKDRKIE